MPEAAIPSDQRTPGERQLLIKNLFIDHDRFREGLKAIGRFHFPVDGGFADSGSVSVLVGDSRTGKTYAAKRYLKDFPPEVGEVGMIFPVLFVDMAIQGTERGLMECVAEALDIKYSQRMSSPSLLLAILAALKARQVQLIILDEFQEVFSHKNKRLLEFGKKFIRKILNLGTLNIICIGLMDTYAEMTRDPQLTGRGGLPYRILRPYDWDVKAERLSFRLLCEVIDKAIPFSERSGLEGPQAAYRLYHVSQGNIGRLKDFVYAAGCLAINDGTDRIEVRHFAEAYDHRKPVGVSFNPFVHDMSLAPATRTSTPDRTGELSAAQLFSKTPAG